MMPQKPGGWFLLISMLVSFVLVAWLAIWLAGWLDGGQQGELDIGNHDTPRPVLNPMQQTTPKPPSVATPAQQPPATDQPATTPSVAAAYAESVAYPPYSQPYQAAFLPADDQQYHAQAIEQADGSAWRLALQHYRYYRPDTLEVSLSVDNLAASTVLSQLRYEIRTMDDDRLLQAGDVMALPSASTANALPSAAPNTAQDGTLEKHSAASNTSSTGIAESSRPLPPQHQLQWSLALSPDDDWPTELSLKVYSDSEHSVRAAFEYVTAVASVEHVDSARTDDHQLKIPVTLAVKQPGLYRIQALLQDRQGQSLALLSHEQRFTTGRQLFELVVHGSVLPSADTELQLRHIRLQLASMHPAEMTRFGRANDEAFALGRFARSDLRQDQYQPTDEEQARMAFLQQLQQGQ